MNIGLNVLPWDSFISCLDSLLGYHTWGIPCFATDCPCGVWCGGLTSCLLYVSKPYCSHLVWNDGGFVSLTNWRTNLSLFFYYVFTNIFMPHNKIIHYLHLPDFRISNNAFLHSIMVFSVYVDVVLAPSTRLVYPYRTMKIVVDIDYIYIYIYGQRFCSQILIKVLEWISNSIPHFTRHVIFYPCWDTGFKSSHVSKSVPSTECGARRLIAECIL